MNKLLEQGIIVYQFTIAGRRVSSILFYTLKNWFSLDDSIRNSETIWTFKNRFYHFFVHFRIIYSILFDPFWLKFLTRLRLGFSHLNEQRFRHNFQDCMNSLCSCSLEIEDTLHQLLPCHHFNHIHIDLMNSVKSVIDNLESCLTKIKEIYFDSSLERIKNKFRSNFYLNKRFCGSLFE